MAVEMGRDDASRPLRQTLPTIIDGPVPHWQLAQIIGCGVRLALFDLGFSNDLDAIVAHWAEDFGDRILPFALPIFAAAACSPSLGQPETRLLLLETIAAGEWADHDLADRTEVAARRHGWR